MLKSIYVFVFLRHHDGSIYLCFKINSCENDVYVVGQKSRLDCRPGGLVLDTPKLH